MKESYQERAVCGVAEVEATPEQVWKAWTTEEGARRFFAPQARIDLRPGGAYEMLFDLTQKPGKQGGEGMMIMAVDEPRMVSFTWNSPPSLPSVREQRTFVVIRLEELDSNLTRVHLHHSGWGSGGEWDDAFAYFQSAWLEVVFPRLKYSFEHGPIDWSNPPRLPRN